MVVLSLVVMIPGNIHALSQTYYVAPGGDDVSGDGSALQPWASITRALDSVSDGAAILVRPGTYTGQVRLRGSFDAGVTLRDRQFDGRGQLHANALVVVDQRQHTL